MKRIELYPRVQTDTSFSEPRQPSYMASGVDPPIGWSQMWSQLYACAEGARPSAAVPSGPHTSVDLGVCRSAGQT